MFAETVTFPAALAAGLLSFFSPCVLPLLPAYFSFITGYSAEELLAAGTPGVRRRVVLSTLAFVAGFSVVFVLLGASASFLGALTGRYQSAIRIIGGILIILFGIHLTGIIRIPALYTEKRVRLQRRPLHILGAFLVGMAFGAGWTPCVGPLLGSILILASGKETVWQGAGLLSVYSAGLAVPFLIISVFIDRILVFLQKARRVLQYVNMAAGVLLIVVGGFLIYQGF